MPARHLARSRGGATRRRLVWVSASGTFASVPIVTTRSVALVLASAFPGSTVMRTHIEMAMSAAAAGDFWQVGIIVGRDTDPGFNIPDPVADPGLPWALNQTFYAVSDGATIRTHNTHTIDLKSKRMFRQPGEAWVLCVSNNALAAQTLNWSARTLIALP